MNKLCGNCGEQHKYVDCPFTEDRIRKEEYNKLREDAEKWLVLEADCQAEIAQVLFLDDIRKNEQDHKDAKKLHGIELMLKRCQELGMENAKGWEENMKLLSRNINDDLKQAKKDRQIVKRLEERIELCEKNPQDKKYVEYLSSELQKILEVKK